MSILKGLFPDSEKNNDRTTFDISDTRDREEVKEKAAKLVWLSGYGKNSQETRKQKEIEKKSLGSSRNGLKLFGTRGLINIGNSCFINSVIQSLSNIEPLTGYFLQERYKAKEKLAESKVVLRYSELLQQLWLKDTDEPYTPLIFIKALMKEVNTLTLGAQQDAVECLTYILDTLHTELNRGDPKYSSKGQEFKDLNEWWENFLKKDNSIITDLFYGVFKNEIICEACGKSNSNFETFNILSLPIPPKTKKPFKFTFISLEKKIYPLEIDYTNSITGEALINVVKEKFPKIRKSEVMLLNNDYTYNLSVENLTENLFEYILKNESVVIVFEKTSLRNAYAYLAVEDEAPSGTKGDWGLRVFTGPVPFQVGIKEKFGSLIKQIKKFLYIQSIYGHDDIEADLHFFSDSVLLNLGESNRKQSSFDSLSTDNQFGEDTKFEEIYNYLNLSKLNSSKPLIIYILISNEIDFDYEKSFTIRDLEKNQVRLLPDRNTNLNDCIDLFKKEEKLSGKNKWKCPSCSTYQNALKKFDIVKYPSFLIVQIKRFRIALKGSKSAFEKGDEFIEFPTTQLSFEEVSYDLTCVVEHFGTLSSGHYKAKCKNFSNNNWHLFDDSTVTEIQGDNFLVTPNAYILFYKKNI